MDSTIILVISSSLLIISILLGVGIYFYYNQEEEVIQEEVIQEEVIEETTTSAPTTPAPTTPAPTVSTPRPTTAAPYEIGKSLKCRSNDVGGGISAIYRYDGNNTLRMYPNSTIAQEWDSNYLDAQSIDCQDLKMGMNMETKLEVGIEPDPDYIGLPQTADTNYTNVPSACYSEAGGDCSFLQYEDCEAEMKSFEKYGPRKTAGDFVIRQNIDNKATLVWNSGTQYLNDDAQMILGRDGILRVMSNDITYWRSSNDESTNGPFAAHLEKVGGKCRLAIYDNDNQNIWSEP